MNTALALAWVGVITLGAWRRRPSPRRIRRLTSPANASRRRVFRREGSYLHWFAVAAMTAVGVATVGWVAVAVVLVIVAVSPRWRRARARRQLDDAVRSGLPDALDLLVLALDAGMTPALAIPWLAERAPPPFGSSFGAVTERVRRGSRLADALAALPEQLGAAAAPLAHGLAAAERDGLPLGPLLDRLADEARGARRRHAEATARRLPVRLAFPLTCCLLPAFVLLTVVPLLAGALGSLHLAGTSDRAAAPVPAIAGGAP